MFYFMTNELHFGPELLGRMALFQSLASLGGILVYMYCCSSTSIRRLLCVSTLAVTPFCLLPIVVCVKPHLPNTNINSDANKCMQQQQRRESSKQKNREKQIWRKIGREEENSYLIFATLCADIYSKKHHYLYIIVFLCINISICINSRMYMQLQLLVDAFREGEGDIFSSFSL